MTKMLRRPPLRFEGTPDPYVLGCTLVPVTDRVVGLNKLNYTVPESSYWRMYAGRPVAIVTVAPGNVYVGWDSCGQCAATVGMCRCPGGVVAPHSVTHIYVSRGGVKPVDPRADEPQQPMKLLKFRKEPKKLLRRPVNGQHAEMAEAMLSEVVKSLKRPARKTLKR